MLLPELKERHARGDLIKVGMVGAGQMGEGLVAQMETMYGMRAFVVCDVLPGRARQVFESAGVAPADIIDTDDPDQAATAVQGLSRAAGSTSLDGEMRVVPDREDPQTVTETHQDRTVAQDLWDHAMHGLRWLANGQRLLHDVGHFPIEV